MGSIDTSHISNLDSNSQAILGGLLKMIEFSLNSKDSSEIKRNLETIENILATIGITRNNIQHLLINGKRPSKIDEIKGLIEEYRDSVRELLQRSSQPSNAAQTTTVIASPTPQAQPSQQPQQPSATQPSTAPSTQPIVQPFTLNTVSMGAQSPQTPQGGQRTSRRRRRPGKGGVPPQPVAPPQSTATPTSSPTTNQVPGGTTATSQGFATMTFPFIATAPQPQAAPHPTATPAPSSTTNQVPGGTTAAAPAPGAMGVGPQNQPTTSANQTGTVTAPLPPTMSNVMTGPTSIPSQSAPQQQPTGQPNSSAQSTQAPITVPPNAPPQPAAQPTGTVAAPTPGVNVMTGPLATPTTQARPVGQPQNQPATGPNAAANNQVPTAGPANQPRAITGRDIDDLMNETLNSTFDPTDPSTRVLRAMIERYGLNRTELDNLKKQLKGNADLPRQKVMDQVQKGVSTNRAEISDKKREISLKDDEIRGLERRISVLEQPRPPQPLMINGQVQLQQETPTERTDRLNALNQAQQDKLTAGKAKANLETEIGEMEEAIEFLNAGGVKDIRYDSIAKLYVAIAQTLEREKNSRSITETQASDRFLDELRRMEQGREKKGISRPRLRAVLKKAAENDPLLKNIGEEKIMELIKTARSQNGINAWADSLPEGVDKAEALARLSCYVDEATKRGLNTIISMNNARALKDNLRSALKRRLKKDFPGETDAQIATRYTDLLNDHKRDVYDSYPSFLRTRAAGRLGWKATKGLGKGLWWGTKGIGKGIGWAGKKTWENRSAIANGANKAVDVGALVAKKSALVLAAGVGGLLPLASKRFRTALFQSGGVKGQKSRTKFPKSLKNDNVISMEKKTQEKAEVPVPEAANGREYKKKAEAA